MEFIKAPLPKYVSFAAQAMNANYLPVKFATERLVTKDKYYEIANQNYMFGLESLEGDLQIRDLNSVLFYISQVLGYTMQQGIPEFNKYQDYPVGSVFTKDGYIWITTNVITGKTIPEVKTDACGNVIRNCCESQCPAPETEVDISKYACKVITSCVFDDIIKSLESKDAALETMIQDLSKIKLVANADGSYTFTNPNATTVTIPAHKASVKVVNKNGEFTFGYLHTEAEKVGEPTSTIHVIESSDLDYNKGFTYNPLSKKVEVDLSDLIKTGSGLATDNEGNIYVVPRDIIDNNTLNLDGNGKVQINPEYTKARDKLATDLANKAKTDANTYTDGKVKELSDNINNNGATVFTNKPIAGNGNKSNPLTLNLGDGLSVDASGKLLVTGVAPKTMSGNMNSGYKLGLNIFSGQMGDSSHAPENYIKGFPINIWSEDKEQNLSTSISDVSTDPNNAYDWSAIAVATDNQVMFQLTGVNSTVWQITNDSGIDSNGNVKDTNAWGKWQKLDNSASITDTMVRNLQDLVNGLNSRIQALENKNSETCKVPLKHVTADYTVVDTDNTLICINDNPITITIPNNIPQGRLFTVVQANNSSITFKAQSGVRLFAPREGSLVMGGRDAVVTILVEIGNVVRIFGDTVSA